MKHLQGRQFELPLLALAWFCYRSLTVEADLEQVYRHDITPKSFLFSIRHDDDDGGDELKLAWHKKTFVPMVAWHQKLNLWSLN